MRRSALAMEALLSNVNGAARKPAITISAENEKSASSPPGLRTRAMVTATASRTIHSRGLLFGALPTSLSVSAYPEAMLNTRMQAKSAWVGLRKAPGWAISRSEGEEACCMRARWRDAGSHERASAVRGSAAIDAIPASSGRMPLAWEVTKLPGGYKVDSVSQRFEAAKDALFGI